MPDSILHCCSLQVKSISHLESDQLCLGWESLDGTFFLTRTSTGFLNHKYPKDTLPTPEDHNQSELENGDTESESETIVAEDDVYIADRMHEAHRWPRNDVLEAANDLANDWFANCLESNHLKSASR